MIDNASSHFLVTATFEKEKTSNGTTKILPSPTGFLNPNSVLMYDNTSPSPDHVLNPIKISNEKNMVSEYIEIYDHSVALTCDYAELKKTGSIAICRIKVSGLLQRLTEHGAATYLDEMACKILDILLMPEDTFRAHSKLLPSVTKINNTLIEVMKDFDGYFLYFEDIVDVLRKCHDGVSQYLSGGNKNQSRPPHANNREHPLQMFCSLTSLHAAPLFTGGDGFSDDISSSTLHKSSFDHLNTVTFSPSVSHEDYFDCLNTATTDTTISFGTSATTKTLVVTNNLADSMEDAGDNKVDATGMGNDFHENGDISVPLEDLSFIDDEVEGCVFSDERDIYEYPCAVNNNVDAIRERDEHQITKPTIEMATTLNREELLYYVETSSQYCNKQSPLNQNREAFVSWMLNVLEKSECDRASRDLSVLMFDRFLCVQASNGLLERMTYRHCSLAAAVSAVLAEKMFSQRSHLCFRSFPYFSKIELDSFERLVLETLQYDINPGNTPCNLIRLLTNECPVLTDRKEVIVNEACAIVEEYWKAVKSSLEYSQLTIAVMALLVSFTRQKIDTRELFEALPAECYHSVDDCIRNFKKFVN